MFIISLHYVKPLEAVEARLADHIAYLDKNYSAGLFLCSGRKNPRTGGIILCRGESMDQVREIVSEDPFLREGIAEIDITEFLPSKFAEGFGSCV